MRNAIKGGQCVSRARERESTGKSARELRERDGETDKKPARLFATSGRTDPERTTDDEILFKFARLLIIRPLIDRCGLK